MKTRLYLLLFVIYLLFCNMTCDDKADRQELIRTELENMDFSGSEMTYTNERTAKEAYVIGVRCFVNTYDWDKELLENNIIAKSAYFSNTKRDFDIITINRFDDEHPAGSSVKDCFSSIHSQTTIKDESISYALAMRKMPVTGEHSFRIIYQLVESETGTETIEADTEPIELY